MAGPGENAHGMLNPPNNNLGQGISNQNQNAHADIITARRDTRATEAVDAGAPTSYSVRMVKNRGGGKSMVVGNPSPKRRKTTPETSAMAIRTGISNESAFEDGDDEICNSALSNFEHQNNDPEVTVITNDEHLRTFDRTTGDIWIYPTNKPVRDYQFNIVQTALFNNTLVSLPTGMGKTFIAAVVMFNFHRWYPKDLIVFLAPTRPLVTQQLEACCNIMGIPPKNMVELTGQVQPNKREEIWKTKNVFFLTPQVMVSDLERGSCPAQQVRLVVVDEAHRAQGNYAYVQVISKLAAVHKNFRVLALSATPGNRLDSVKDVLRNLLISKVEIRSEGSLDILPYINHKEIETIVVSLDSNIKLVLSKILEIFQRYTGKLVKQNVLSGRLAHSATQYQLIKSRETFRSVGAARVPMFRKGMIELDFASAITLARSLELLTIHGLRSFYSFLNGVMKKDRGHVQVTSELRRNTNIKDILNDLKMQFKLKPAAVNSTTNTTLTTGGGGSLAIDGDTNEIVLYGVDDADYTISHPKFKILKEIVTRHFESSKASSLSTRAMIFTQYRDCVQEIGCMLGTLRPLLKPVVFIGQSSGSTGRGLKQKDQMQIMQKFRSGEFNTVVSTCVGEEGLDFCEVDLIVCFDCNKSPTRLIQRMGRTGRQREGRVVCLLTEGREESMYRHSVYQSKKINKSMLDTSKLNAFLCNESPRMIPSGIQPRCFKMDIVLSSEQKEASSLEGQHRDYCGDSAIPKTVERMNRDEEYHLDELTMTQCFAKNSEIVTYHPKPLGQPSVPSCSRSREKSPVCNIEYNASVDCTKMTTPWNDKQYQFVCRILNIGDETEEATAQCIRLPKSPAKLEWQPKYNKINPDKIVLKEDELTCIKEKVETAFLLGDFANQCGCGLVFDNNWEDDFDFDEGEERFDQNITGAVNQNTCPGSNTELGNTLD